MEHDEAAACLISYHQDYKATIEWDQDDLGSECLEGFQAEGVVAYWIF